MRPIRSQVLRVLFYGTLLGLGALGLQWLEYGRMIRLHADEVAYAMVATGFLLLGLLVGARAMGARSRNVDPGNPAATEALGISPRELGVLRELAAGRSNKEIAIVLGVSPNTVKTHVAKLYMKLDARRRTEAVGRAQALGILP